jgi:protocatechuate 3,4-dioxygenase beta subunit
MQLDGQLIDAHTNQPISGAIVEFWQACATGRYNHPRDTNTAKLDPDFQYWAQVRTGAQGEFSIRSIIPGAYKASSTWIRPPHIHVKVHKAGYRSLTTQLYFAGDPLNDLDSILQALTPDQQSLVVVDFKEEDLVHRGQWKILIAKPSGVNEAHSDALVTPELE